jgi:hypothetical protein
MKGGGRLSDYLYEGVCEVKSNCSEDDEPTVRLDQIHGFFEGFVDDVAVIQQTGTSHQSMKLLGHSSIPTSATYLPCDDNYHPNGKSVCLPYR